jgi:hypothetical protein
MKNILILGGGFGGLMAAEKFYVLSRARPACFRRLPTGRHHL